MADKRMFTKKVTDDENFMNLSSSAQALYLHLSMSADDDGFSNQISVSMFKAHASIQDLEALLEKRYIYQFSNGVIVIKHWRMANALRKDRYTPTAFQEELKQLQLKDNGSYTLEKGNWLPNGCQMVAVDKNRLDKNRLDKNSIDNNKEKNTKKNFSDLVVGFTDNKELQIALKDFYDMRIKMKRPITERAAKQLFNKLDNLADNDSLKIKIVEQSIIKCWLDFYELKDKEDNSEDDKLAGMDTL